MPNDVHSPSNYDDTFYRVLFYDSPYPSLITDLTGNIFEVNSAAESLLGYNKLEFCELGLKKLVGEDSQTVTQFFKELADSEYVTSELKLKNKNGLLLPVELKCRVMKTKDINPRVYIVFNDLSELKIRQMLIKEASEFGKVILKSSLIGIAAYNNLGECIIVNEAFAGIIGATKSQLLRQNFNRIQSWKDYGLYDNALEVLKSEKPVRKEIYMVTTFGKSAWLDFTFSPFKVNKETYLLIMIDDITQRKYTEELLKKSEEKFRSSVESMTDPMAIFEAARGEGNTIKDFIIKFINKAGIKIISRHSGNISAHSLLEFFMQRAKADIFNEICKVVESGESLTRESIVYDSSGKNIEYAVLINAVKLEDGVVINWRDITEHKIIEKELSELNKNKDKFLSIIAHDLRSPFHSIIGMTEFLAEDPEWFSSEEKKEIFQETNKHVKSVFQLLENLLQWAGNQIDFSYNPENFSINQMIDTELKVFIPVAKEKAISIRFDNSVPDYDVTGDKKMIATVIRNLISNAIKFSYPGGEIKIYLSQMDDKVSVAIEDKGLGISKENIAKILNLGEKFTTIGTKKERGSGFGLVLVKDLLEKNKSELVIKSTPGEGSTFSFTLQLK